MFIFSFPLVALSQFKLRRKPNTCTAFSENRICIFMQIVSSRRKLREIPHLIFLVFTNLSSTDVLKTCYVHGQNWKSQPYFNQLNMFATCSATNVSMAPTMPDQRILRKTVISKITIFYPKMKFFHNTRKILCLMKTILCHTQNHANSTFLRVKGTLIWPEKKTYPLRG